MADTSSFTPVFREVVEPTINDILDESTILMRYAEQKKRSFDGNQFQIVLNIAHNQGIGARSENGALPEAGNEAYVRAKFSPADNWGQMKFSQRLIEMAKSNKGALKEAISSESDGLTKALKQELNRQWFGDGTGLLATLGTSTATNTITCTNTKFIVTGMRVDILTISSGAILVADRKVTKVVTNTSFDIDGAATTTSSSHGVYRAGNTVGTTNYEFVGLEGMIKASGTYATIDPTAAGNEKWISTVKTGVGNLSDQNMQAAWDGPYENGLEASTDRIVIGTTGTRRQYGVLLQGQRRFTVATVGPAKNPRLQGGGFDSLDYNGTDFLADRMCPAQTNYYIDQAALEWLVLARGFKTDGGSSVLKDDGGTGYTAPYYVMATPATSNRGAHAKQTGVTES
jgi:hypothetical protein